MGITSSLYTGVTGLQTLGNSLQVAGNNIANVNTVGYKAGRAEFSDLLSQTISLGGQTAQLGRGVRLEAISRSFSQGSFQNTDNVTDLAISGKGFFVLSNGAANFYTRDGAFHVDSDGNLVNSDDLGVQGYLYNAAGTPTGTTGTINLSNLTTPPNPTALATINANLDASAPVMVFNPASPAATSNYSTSLTVYDSLGNSHNMIVYFNKTADNAWGWHAAVNASEVTPLTPDIVDGTMTFTDSGALDTVTIDPLWTGFNFAGGAAPDQLIDFDFGDDIAGGGTGLAGSTQFGGSFATNFQSQDGFQTGNLQAVNVNSDGTIVGIFSNGRSRTVAQVALANFQNEGGLFSTGSNLFVETPQSGTAILSAPGSGAAGEIAGNSLEQSNVDLSTEFVTLITNQRGFQANARVITTSSELLQDVVNLVR